MVPKPQFIYASHPSHCSEKLQSRMAPHSSSRFSSSSPCQFNLAISVGWVQQHHFYHLLSSSCSLNPRRYNVAFSIDLSTYSNPSPPLFCVRKFAHTFDFMWVQKQQAILIRQGLLVAMASLLALIRNRILRLSCGSLFLKGSTLLIHGYSYCILLILIYIFLHYFYIKK